MMKMSSDHWLERFLSEHINSSKPDGRPLYAYKCQDEAYDRLKEWVGKMFASAKNGDPPLNFAPLFSLFAAETWRRRHAGGKWKWETVFKELQEDTPNYPQIPTWIQDGLNYWKREILKSNLGKHLYLITIACEGGLPLLLLQKENASLYRYFKNLLQAYHHERSLPNCDVVTIAKRLASYLPKSLQQEIVYELGGDLVKKVVDLQYMVPEAADPIVALDKKRPNWRDDLPLPLGEKTVELLLNNLVNEAKTLIISERQQIRWRRLLFNKNGEWQIEQNLELPNLFTGSSLRKWINKETLMPRLRILLQTAQEIIPVALVTRLRGEGDDAKYRCEVLKRKGVRVSGVQALKEFRLLLSDGQSESEITVRGGEGWGSLPWIFRERDGQWEYLREGSARCKEDRIRVVSPLNGNLEAMEGECDFIGTISEIKREVWQCSGTILWKHPQYGTCRIQCASQDATEDVLSLEGKRFYSETDMAPTFVGLPNLYAVTPDGRRRALNLPMKWRPYAGGGLEWSHDSHACMGDVWLRYSDTDGNQLLQRRVRVVPETLQIEIDQLGKNETIGRLCLSGLAGGQVCCIDRSDCDFEIKSQGNVNFIYCLSEVGLPITNFDIRLHWTDGRSFEMSLPFPQTGGVFMFSGQALPDRAQIPVTRLAAVKAVAQAPLSGQRFYLNVKIKSNSYHVNKMWLQEPFEVGKDGRGIFFLHRLQERLTSLLSLTGELDAWVLVEIIDDTNTCFASLKVKQFDMRLEPDKENRQVLLPQDCQERFDDGWESRISIRMVPLWAPEKEPIILKKSLTQATWNLPQNLEPGPWWVLGEDGDWARFRPLLWSQSGEIEAIDSPLERAIRQSDPEIRKQMYCNWIDQIAMDPNHRDWTTFFNLLHLVRPYPASAMDLFSAAIASPEAMVMLLLCSEEEDFETVWSLSSQLPFSWYLLPINAWMSAAKCYFSSLRIALSEISKGEDLVWNQFEKFKGQVTSLRPFFKQICDWLSYTIFPGKPLQNSELEIARNHPEVIESLIPSEELNLQGRHDSEEQYPEGSQIMRRTDQIDFPKEYKYWQLAEPFKPVRCAPFVAAQISLKGQAYDKKLLFELKETRDFDSEWFNRAYAFALCLGLSQTL